MGLSYAPTQRIHALWRMACNHPEVYKDYVTVHSKIIFYLLQDGCMLVLPSSLGLFRVLFHSDVPTFWLLLF